MNDIKLHWSAFDHECANIKNIVSGFGLGIQLRNRFPSPPPKLTCKSIGRKLKGYESGIRDAKYGRNDN